MPNLSHIHVSFDAGRFDHYDSATVEDATIMKQRLRQFFHQFGYQVDLLEVSFIPAKLEVDNADNK